MSPRGVYPRAPVEERFWAKVDRWDPDYCWLWTGAKAGGYPQFWIAPKVVHSYRVAYEWLVGPIPAGMELDHLCRNPACVNPKHLEPVTHRVNVLRGVAPAALNARRTHCRRGHPLAGANLRTDARSCRQCQRDNAAARRLVRV